VLVVLVLRIYQYRLFDVLLESILSLFPSPDAPVSIINNLLEFSKISTRGLIVILLRLLKTFVATSNHLKASFLVDKSRVYIINHSPSQTFYSTI